MSLYRRGNSKNLWCRFTIGGVEVRQSTGTSVRKDAEEYETALRNRYWRQAKLGEVFYTFGDATKQWLSETTISTKGKDEQILTWLCDRKDEQGHSIGLRDVPLSEITFPVIDAIRKNLTSGNLAPATVNHYLGTLRKILRKAHMHWRTCDNKPWLEFLPHVQMLKRELPDPIWTDRDGLRKLMAELPEHSADITMFGVATGLRMSNITRLRKSCIDRDRRAARVEGSGAKGGKGIPVPLNADAMAIVNKWWDRHETHLFCYQGRPIKCVTTKAWHKAVKRAGLDPQFTFHKVRHTWASWQVQSGTPLSVLQELGRWADFQMVQRYAHLDPGHLTPYARRTLLGTPKKRAKRKRVQVIENGGDGRDRTADLGVMNPSL